MPAPETMLQSNRSGTTVAEPELLLQSLYRRTLQHVHARILAATDQNLSADLEREASHPQGLGPSRENLCPPPTD